MRISSRDRLEEAPPDIGGPLRPYRPSTGTGRLKAFLEAASSLTIPARGLLELVSPPACLVCARILRSGCVCSACLPVRHLPPTRCRRCHGAVLSPEDEKACDLCRLFPPLFGSIRYLWDYAGRAKELITAMKYRPSFSLAKESARLLGGAMPELFEPLRWDAIVPVPSSRRSLRSRGFNQCEVLARGLHGYGPISTGLLLHRGYRSVQAALPAERRFANVKTAFRVSSRRRIPQRVLIVDDVLTTGATASAAAAALLDGGVESIDLVCLARSPSWTEHRHDVFDIWSRRRRATLSAAGAY